MACGAASCDAKTQLCAAGETCCEEQSWMPDDYIVHYNTCLPLQQQSELTALGYV